ncbi:MAG: VTT domain-containing protein [Gammaproteobacteria bacterium]|nr:VTT domain-containing protein [Gammaproteobacteria bacterium]
MLAGLLDFVLHLDRHLVDLLARFHAWLYPLLFGVIFAETGFVVTPFLPGDSLLFAVGALAAVDASGTLRAPLLILLLASAAVLGNLVNYGVGRLLGPPAFSGRYRLLKVEYLERTEAFFRRHGALAVLLSRFVPILRTCAPFVAGVARMPLGRFFLYNLVGGIAWVMLFVGGGYLFGNIPPVKAHFGLVTVAIIVLSLVPVALTLRRARYEPSGVVAREGEQDADQRPQ